MAAKQKYPWMKWYTAEWLSDEELGKCSPATRGIFSDAICAMHKSDQCGQLVGSHKELSRVCRCTVGEMVAAIAELKRTNTADVHEADGEVTLCNRRMRSQFLVRKSGADRKKRYDQKKRNAPCNGDVTAQNKNTDTKNNNSPPAHAVVDRYAAAPSKPPDPVVVALLRGYGITEAVCIELGAASEARVRRAAEKAMIQKKRKPDLDVAAWIISAVRGGWEFEDNFIKKSNDEYRAALKASEEKKRKAATIEKTASDLEEVHRAQRIADMSDEDLQAAKAEYLGTLKDGLFKTKMESADPKKNPTLQAYALKRLAGVA